MAKELSE